MFRTFKKVGEKLRNNNKTAQLTQFDIFKKPIFLRTERSIEGKVWDDKHGSWFGVFVSFSLFLMVCLYSRVKLE